jgi:hypothetical protein
VGYSPHWAVLPGVRREWVAFDLVTVDGIRVEVKSAAYIQSWHQEHLSPIVFRVPKTHAWNADTNRLSGESRRQADVYVFAVLAEKDQDRLNPLDLSQWEFYVVPTAWLDSRARSRHSITLPSLRALSGSPVSYSALCRAVQRAAEEQRKLTHDNEEGRE